LTKCGPLLNIAVDPAEQGKGYGKALTEHFLDVCEQAKAESAWLEVRESNQRALSWCLSSCFGRESKSRWLLLRTKHRTSLIAVVITTQPTKVKKTRLL